MQTFAVRFIRGGKLTAVRTPILLRLSPRSTISFQSVQGYWLGSNATLAAVLGEVIRASKENCKRNPNLFQMLLWHWIQSSLMSSGDFFLTLASACSCIRESRFRSRQRLLSFSFFCWKTADNC